MPSPLIVIVHIGAGQHDKSQLGYYRAICEKATAAGLNALNLIDTPKGLSKALYAVLSAISVLEEDPNLNCGYGSNLTWDKTVECDASIMDGKSGLFGAVGAIEGIQYPIQAAGALVKEQAEGILLGGRVPPMFLCGPNAFPWFKTHTPSLIIPPVQLISEQALLRYEHHLDIYMKHFDIQWEHPLNHDTVGAIVMDQEGNIAAGVSSGGISLKYCGRVGEAAVYGAGCWAQNQIGTKPGVGISCSGTGEQIIQSFLAKSCAEALTASGNTLNDISDVLSSFAAKSGTLMPVIKSAGVVALSSTDSVPEYVHEKSI